MSEHGAVPQAIANEANDAPPTAQAQYDAPFAVSISFPESVVIKMVDASALNDYELGLFFSSVFFGGFIGFAVAAVQSAMATTYVVLTAMFAVLAIVAFGWALSKRRKMTSRLRAFKLRTSGVEQISRD
jgi:hypothetical protein